MARLLVFILSLIFSNYGYSQRIPEIKEVPNRIPSEQKIVLDAKYALLTRLKASMLYEIKKFNAKCDKEIPVIPENKLLLSECDKQERQLENAIKQLIDSINNFEETRTIYAMVASAKELKWDADEIKRLDIALNSLHPEGDPLTTKSQVIAAWDQIQNRNNGEESAVAFAAIGEGPGLPGAGNQKKFTDCAIFALANATGFPYGAVAAYANKLISEGEWHNSDERKKFQEIIEKQGLNGGEVIMLTEALGRVEVIPSTAFEKTLKEGRPVMVNVVPYNGNFELGHQIVLTKTFQHKSETWFEMIDSNQKGTQQRLYLTTAQLKTILKENGVVYRPDPNTTPGLFR